MTNSNSSSENLGFLNLIIIFFSIYVLIALLIDTFFKLPSNIHDLLQIIDDGVCVLFIYEFFYRLFTAKNKLNFLKWGWIDLISSIPSFPFVRFGRLFRLVRLLRILRAFRSVRVLAKHIFRSRVQGTMSLVAILTCLIVIFSSISILIVEKDPSCNIKSAEDAIWWSLVTVTTVGYGDKYPVTTEGRIIGAVLMFVGVGMFGTFTAYIASWFTTGALIENEKGKENDIE
ncbi:MAG: ion transporter [Bacteroidetes bacterium]|nr:ion transporter [Bacteroidota bacterium]